MSFDEERMSEFIRFLRRKSVLSLLFSLKEKTRTYKEMNEIANSDSNLNFFISEGVRFGLLIRESRDNTVKGADAYEYNLTLFGLMIVEHLQGINDIVTDSGDRIYELEQ